MFYGTGKRAENAFTQYLTENAGSHNACTSEDYTLYYFDIKNDALDGAL